MKILCIGDVVGRRAIDHLSRRLRPMQNSLGVDFTVANGENAAEIHGITSADADALLAAGVDLITLGNHTYSARDIGTYLDDHAGHAGREATIIRPANFPATAPGVGYTVREVSGRRILCFNIMGQAFMDPLDDPFAAANRILAQEKGNYDLALCDFHAEATSEKQGMGFHLDGRVSVLFGTHTHVPTADNRVLPHGTGYVTDLGMTGPQNGILGTDAAAVLRKMRDRLPARFTVADGPIEAQAVLFTVEDQAPWRCVKTERVTF